MAIGVVGERLTLSMPCDIETRRPPARQATYHADCPRPDTCACPAHQRDAEPEPER